MPGIVVVGKDSAGGAQLGGGQGFWNVEGAKVVVIGDAVAGHGNGPHQGPAMVQASSWMTLNGKPVCRAGDMASCGHTSTGRPWFNIA